MSVQGVETPELDKQHKIIESGASDTLTEFYDWLHDQGYCIAEEIEHEWEDEYDDYGHMLHPVRIRPEQLFADFFGIDLDKIETERRAILDALREAQ